MDRVTQLQDALDLLTTMMATGVQTMVEQAGFQELPTAEAYEGGMNGSGAVEGHGNSAAQDTAQGTHYVITAKDPNALEEHQLELKKKELARDIVAQAKVVETLLKSMPGLGSSKTAQAELLARLEHELADADQALREARSAGQVVLDKANGNLPIELGGTKTKCAHGLLLLHLDWENIDDPRIPMRLIETATERSERSLSVLIFCDSIRFQPDSTTSTRLIPSQDFTMFQTLLSMLYGSATKVCLRDKKLTMPVEIIFEAMCGYNFCSEGDLEKEWDTVFFGESSEQVYEGFLKLRGSRPLPRPIPLEEDLGDANAQSPNLLKLRKSRKDVPEIYESVVCGGTFDHLHAGHLILLTSSIFLASRRVIVGISDTSLLQEKKHAEHLESIDRRILAVQTFLAKLKRSVGQASWVTAIQDVYGPTATERDVQALIVSQETTSGAQAIAKKRRENGLNQLDEYVIDVVGNISDPKTSASRNAKEAIESKISSTFIRQQIAEGHA